MTASTPRTLLLTGASGALGQSRVAAALGRWSDLRLICLVRSDQAAASARTAAGAHMRRVTVVTADLTRAASMAEAARQLGDPGPVLGVHTAADVSWEREAEEMAALNVEGSLHFLRLLQQVSARPRLIYLSTAYTRAEDWTYRNGYEITKAEAERRLRRAAGAMPVSVFACSLIVGHSRTGAIGRYNGIYPILKFVAEYAPPFLVGNRGARLDIVPVDWVCDELLALCEDHWQGRAPRDVIASAGPAARIGFERVLRIGEERIAAFDARLGLPRAEPVPVVRTRQWAFLKRCLAAWNPPELSVSDFRYFERLLQVYGAYSENDLVRAPLGVTTPAPQPEAFLPVAFDHWIAQHATRLTQRRQRLAEGRAEGRADA
jgi:nucleoside-diphosphate-sugar epimerase